MTNLSKDVNTHVVITFQRSKYFITAKQHEILLNADSSKIMNIGEATIRVSTIAEATTIEKYYQDHPKERPQYENHTKQKELPDRIKITKSGYLRALKGFLKGINNYQRNTKSPSKWSVDMVEKVNKRIKEAGKMPEDKEFNQLDFSAKRRNAFFGDAS